MVARQTKTFSATFEKFSSWLTALLVFLLVIIAVMITHLFFSKQPENVVLACPSCPICPKCPECPLTSNIPSRNDDPVVLRDKQVLHNELYPPLNRSNYDTTIAIMENPRVRPLATRDGNDTFRLVAYMVSQEDKEDVWKVFAREQHRNGRAEFYATPANKNMDIKIDLSNDTVVGSEKFRDVYSFPDMVKVNHPMFTRGTNYQVVPLPTNNLSSGYI